MCTSFALTTAAGRLVGMNFDNDGKEVKVTSLTGGDLTFLVKTPRGFFPSFGVSASGVFVNDLMVDDRGQGKYVRQNDRRWVTTRLVQSILEGTIGPDDLPRVLSTVEIVNNPGTSTHSLIVRPDGRAWVVEPGSPPLAVEGEGSEALVLTNFPLGPADALQPEQPKGSGADRYAVVRRNLTGASPASSVEQAFELLAAVRQDGPVWKTQISLVYDLGARTVHYAFGGPGGDRVSVPLAHR